MIEHICLKSDTVVYINITQLYCFTKYIRKYDYESVAYMVTVVSLGPMQA